MKFIKWSASPDNTGTRNSVSIAWGWANPGREDRSGQSVKVTVKLNFLSWGMGLLW